MFWNSKWSVKGENSLGGSVNVKAMADTLSITDE